MNQPTCPVESLLRNMDNNVGQTIPSPSALPNGMIPVTGTVSNTHNVVNAIQYEATIFVDIPIEPNIDWSEKNAKIDSFMKLCDVEEAMTNRANTLHDLEENKSNELLVTRTKSAVIRSIDRFISDLSENPNGCQTSNLRGTVQTYRDGARITSIALKRTIHIKD